MASQFRLHVLLPIAVLGALGLGVGAFAFGSQPAGDEPPPLVTTHPDKKPAKKGLTKKEWAASADAWCADVFKRLQPSKDALSSSTAFETWFGEVVQTADSAESTFADLGWPQGEKKKVLVLRANLRQTVKSFRRAFNQFQQGNVAGVKAALARVDDAGWSRTMAKLGARVCTDGGASAAKSALEKRVAIKPAPELLRDLLRRYRVVVVLFYKPDASYDAIQTREARAGALAAGAGFLAVNVSKNIEVGELASQYGVLEAPTVLVLTRGPVLESRFEGFTDRTAVTQAARNAR